jgi:hypothetical protein
VRLFSKPIVDIESILYVVAIIDDDGEIRIGPIARQENVLIEEYKSNFTILLFFFRFDFEFDEFENLREQCQHKIFFAYVWIVLRHP